MAYSEYPWAVSDVMRKPNPLLAAEMRELMQKRNALHVGVAKPGSVGSTIPYAGQPTPKSDMDIKSLLVDPDMLSNHYKCPPGAQSSRNYAHFDKETMIFGLKTHSVNRNGQQTRQALEWTTINDRSHAANLSSDRHPITAHRTRRACGTRPSHGNILAWDRGPPLFMPNPLAPIDKQKQTLQTFPVLGAHLVHRRVRRNGLDV